MIVQPKIWLIPELLPFSIFGLQHHVPIIGKQTYLHFVQNCRPINRLKLPSAQDCAQDGNNYPDHNLQLDINRYKV